MRKTVIKQTVWQVLKQIRNGILHIPWWYANFRVKHHKKVTVSMTAEDAEAMLRQAYQNSVSLEKSGEQKEPGRKAIGK